MMGIGNSLGISPAISAGAILTGAYFGDKLSPLSDTTNLAAAVAGTDLARHIRYMSITTIPTYTISLLIFTGISLTKSTFSVESAATGQLVEVLQQNFYITPYSLLVPALVIFLIAFRFPSIPAIFVGLLGGIISALLFQTDFALSGLDYRQKISLLMQVITTSHETHTGLDALDELLSTGGMAGMLNTVWLIISAMCFGGAMEASGFLRRITDAIMSLAKSEFSLFAATTGTTLFVNITASDQYLSLVIPGKMYAPSYTQKGLAPENLSRTLEDSGTVTSVLIPWNTCGAYHSGILGVATFSYLPFVFFSLLSPFTTLLVAALQIKIKRL
jgi:NhaC family Na+:H+ antiporter